MRIECPECSSPYEVRPSERRRRARCKQCGALITIEATAAAPAPARPTDARPTDARPTRAPQVARAPERSPRERRPREKPRLLKSAIVVAIGCILAGLLVLALLALPGLGLLFMMMDESSSSFVAGKDVAMLLVQGVLALCMIGSGVGLLLHKPWGWWGASLLYAALLAVSLKLMTPILSIDWGHPDALATAFVFFVAYGLPIPVAAPMLVLLLRSPMRLAYGVQQARYARHRSSVRPQE